VEGLHRGQPPTGNLATHISLQPAEQSREGGRAGGYSHESAGWGRKESTHNLHSAGRYSSQQQQPRRQHRPLWAPPARRRRLAWQRGRGGRPTRRHTSGSARSWQRPLGSLSAGAGPGGTTPAPRHAAHSPCTQRPGWRTPLGTGAAGRRWARQGGRAGGGGAGQGEGLMRCERRQSEQRPGTCPARLTASSAQLSCRSGPPLHSLAACLVTCRYTTCS
jgi:hypothetical protein